MRRDRRATGGPRGRLFLEAVDLVGALTRPVAAGAGAVPRQVVGHLGPREAGAAVLDDGCERFLLALVPFPASVGYDDLRSYVAHCRTMKRRDSLKGSAAAPVVVVGRAR